MTALDNGNPRGGWNIILRRSAGAEGEENWEAVTGAKRMAKGDETEGLSCGVPLFRRGSYLPCVPPLVQSPPDMPYIFGRAARLYPLRDRVISSLSLSLSLSAASRRARRSQRDTRK